MDWPYDFINNVICGDCLEVMKHIPDNSVDLVVTDPPYGISQAGVIHKRSVGMGSRRYDFFDGDSLPMQMLNNTVLPSLRMMIKKLKDNGSIYVWLSHRQIGDIVTLLEANGFRTRPMAWVKTAPPPAPPNTGWASGFEICIYGTLPKRTWNQDRVIMSNVFVADSYRHGNPQKTGHPTQKPISVIGSQIKASSDKGDIILDPFLGSGTTPVAAKQLGRKYIGIEIIPDYCKIAEQRLAQTILI